MGKQAHRKWTSAPEMEGEGRSGDRASALRVEEGSLSSFSCNEGAGIIAGWEMPGNTVGFSGMGCHLLSFLMRSFQICHGDLG